MKKNLNTSRGFTLVEMLVVVAIIALLAGIILPNILNSRTRARDAKRVSDLAQIQLALEQYFNRCQQYPTYDASSGSVPANNTNTVALNRAFSNGCSGVTFGTYISNIPTDPTTGSAYTYYYNPSYTAGTPAASDYILKTTLEGNLDSLKDSLTSGANATQPAWATTAGISCNTGAGSLVYCIGPQ